MTGEASGKIEYHPLDLMISLVESRWRCVWIPGWDGGMGGNLIVRNPMGFSIKNWEVSFLAPHDQFQSWAGAVTVKDVGNDAIPAYREISISFNAQGVELPHVVFWREVNSLCLQSLW